MAYLDDNNDNLTRGGDPLEELDRELAQLRATLGELDSDGDTVDSASDTAVLPDSQAEQPAKPADNIEPPVSMNRTYDRSEEDMRKQAKKPSHTSRGKKSGTGLIIGIILAVILVVGAIASVAFGGLNIFRQKDEGATVATAGGEVVTINDSVMGDIELQTVKGAEINTKTAENLVTEEDGTQAYYQDGKKISHLGVDLSEFQGEVDFAKAKAAGVEFVMLRIGGRYYGDDGGMYEDKAFDTYYEQAKAAGLKVGAYFFSQAVSAEDAADEANFALSKLGGRKLDYPLAFDWENIAQEDARTDNVTGEELTVIAEAFCDAVINAGYKAIVYSNTQQMFIMYDFETMKDYDFWLADYRDFPTMYYNYDMWQYATDGKIDGIEGDVDMNLSFTDFDD